MANMVYARQAESPTQRDLLCHLLTKQYCVGKDRNDWYLLEHAAGRSGETHEIAPCPATT